jgi:hypothetical protein
MTGAKEMPASLHSYKLGLLRIGEQLDILLCVCWTVNYKVGSLWLFCRSARGVLG